MAEWIKVATKSEVPTDTGKLVSAGGWELALFQFEGKVYALENACAHKGGPLAEGGLHGNLAMCPWHGWEFDVKTGVSSFNPGIKQRTFPVKEDHGDIYVQI